MDVSTVGLSSGCPSRLNYLFKHVPVTTTPFPGTSCYLTRRDGTDKWRTIPYRSRCRLRTVKWIITVLNRFQASNSSTSSISPQREGIFSRTALQSDGAIGSFLAFTFLP